MNPQQKTRQIFIVAGDLCSKTLTGLLRNRNQFYYSPSRKSSLPHNICCRINIRELGQPLPFIKANKHWLKVDKVMRHPPQNGYVIGYTFKKPRYSFVKRLKYLVKLTYRVKFFYCFLYIKQW